MVSWGLIDSPTALFSLTPHASWQLVGLEQDFWVGVPVCLLMNGWTVWSDWLRTGSLIDILFLLVTNLGNLGVNRHSLGLQIDESKGRRKQALYCRDK